MLIVEEFTQPLAAVPVTEYVVVVVGSAVTTLPVVPDNPVGGDHEKELAPEAVNTVDSPLQISLSPLMLMLGVAFTVMVTKVESNSIQPPPTVYRMASYVPGVAYVTETVGSEGITFGSPPGKYQSKVSS